MKYENKLIKSLITSMESKGFGMSILDYKTNFPCLKKNGLNIVTWTLQIIIEKNKFKAKTLRFYICINIVTWTLQIIIEKNSKPKL